MSALTGPTREKHAHVIVLLSPPFAPYARPTCASAPRTASRASCKRSRRNRGGLRTYARCISPPRSCTHTASSRSCPSSSRQPAGASVHTAELGDVPVWDHDAAGVSQDANHQGAEHIERGLPERGGDGQARAIAGATTAAHFRAHQVYEGDDSTRLSEACCALTQENGCSQSG